MLYKIKEKFMLIYVGLILIYILGGRAVRAYILH
jgi:hypothetical protein